jgi:hydrogenase maturation protein HypF
MACSWLLEAFGEEEPSVPPALRGRVSKGTWRAVSRLARTASCSPLTTSMGRLFDAVAALCGLGVRASYEGQAAIALENEAARAPEERGAYPLPVYEDGAGAARRLVLDPVETVRAIVSDLSGRVSVAGVAARFHNAIAAATAQACAEAAERHGLDTAVLSGGVFQNRLLLERTSALALEHGLRVLVPARLPPNDGGISYGQAAAAAALVR